jgi:hypothetical protein
MTSITDREQAARALNREGRRQRVRRIVPLDSRRQRLAIRIGIVIVAAFLVAGGVLVYQASQGGKQITAYFSEAIGVYPGSTVRVLGVPVGTVDARRPWWWRRAWSPTATCSSPRPTPAARRSPTTR